MTLLMQNGKDIKKGVADNIMIVGPPGSGKSKLVTTLPGKTFVFAFDPAASDAYAGLEHIDIIQYRVDSMDLGVVAKRSTGGDTQVVGSKKPQTYIRFGEDLTEFVNEGVYKNYDYVVVDSATTFEAAERDHVMYVNNTYGHVPKLDDHNLVANQTLKIFRMLTNLPCSVVFIVHDALEQDDTTKKLMNRLLLTGKGNRRMMPSFFNHILRTEAKRIEEKEGKKTHYFVATQSDQFNPYVRTSWENLDDRVDVTIGNFAKPQTYGLGKLIKGQKR